MNNEDIEKILEKHKKWLQNIDMGFRANLEGANLIGADLRYVDLRCANLIGANLRGAKIDRVEINPSQMKELLKSLGVEF